MLKNINYKFLKGKVTLISGPSGGGKSTLINIISGIISTSEGNISILGYNLNSNFKKIRPYISCVWNETSLFSNMSVINNLRFFAFLRGQTLKETDIKIMTSYIVLELFTIKINLLVICLKEPNVRLIFVEH